jgi:transcriptional regulator with XRE-family HTH domain
LGASLLAPSHRHRPGGGDLSPAFLQRHHPTAPGVGCRPVLKERGVTDQNSTRPKFVIVYFRGAPYQLNLVVCRRALVRRQIEGELDNMNSLARAVGVSRSTASRFFSGRSTSLAVTLRILDKLRLSFDEVAKPVELGNVQIAGEPLGEELLPAQGA